MLEEINRPIKVKLGSLYPGDCYRHNLEDNGFYQIIEYDSGFLKDSNNKNRVISVDNGGDLGFDTKDSNVFKVNVRYSVELPK